MPLFHAPPQKLQNLKKRVLKDHNGKYKPSLCKRISRKECWKLFSAFSIDFMIFSGISRKECWKVECTIHSPCEVSVKNLKKRVLKVVKFWNTYKVCRFVRISRKECWKLIQHSVHKHKPEWISRKECWKKEWCDCNHNHSWRISRKECWKLIDCAVFYCSLTESQEKSVESVLIVFVR